MATVASSTPTLADLNLLDRDAFAAALAPLHEGQTWAAAAAWDARPFASGEDLRAALAAAVLAGDRDRQLSLVRAHPDLAGRAARSAEVSAASRAEQAAAGLAPDRIAPEAAATFDRLNAAYRERFGFPFVVCARESDRDSVLAGLERRLGNAEGEELATALAEIDRITRYRLQDLLGSEAGASPAQSPTAADEGGEAGPAVRYQISYGKRAVPLYRVRAAPLHGVPPIPESPFVSRDNTLLAAEVTVEVLGDGPLRAYTHGDNAGLVATDSIKNLVLREALAFEGATLEALLAHLARRFGAAYTQLRHLRLEARELPFAPVTVPTEGGGFATSGVLYARGHGDRSVVELETTSDGGEISVRTHRCGIVGIELLKTTGSAFTRFVRDGNTTLPDRVDRPLFVLLDVHWRYADPGDALGHDHARYVPAEQVGDLCRAVFHRLVSESIQHLVHEMGVALLARFPQLAEVGFAAENRTRDPVAGDADAVPDGPRVYTDPFPAYGLITLVMSRTGVSA